MAEDLVDDWTMECPSNCTIVIPKNVTNFQFNVSDVEEDLLLKTFLDGSRFWIQRVLLPIIVVVGVLGNGVTVVVLTRRRMRSSTNTYLTALAISDLLYLVFVFTLSLEHYPYTHHTEYFLYWVYRPFGLWLTDATTSTSIWLTVTFTVERYIAVCHPLHGKILCTESRARLAIVLVYFFSFLATVTTPFEWEVECKCSLVQNVTSVTFDLKWSTLGSNKIYRTIYYRFWSISCVFLPLILLAIFNTFLILAVHRSTKTRRQMTQRDQNSSTQKLENKITITLIAVVILFLICQIPTAIVLIYESLNTGRSTRRDLILRVCGNVANVLVVVNAAANFLLYTALSAKYRRTLLATFFWRCYPPASPGHSSANTPEFSRFGRGTSTAMTIIRDRTPRERTKSTKSVTMPLASTAPLNGVFRRPSISSTAT